MRPRHPPDNTARSPSPLWRAYAGLLLTIALLQSVASLQQYLARGGRHAWEPFLWEFSSVLCTGLLSVAIYRWHVAGLRLDSGPLQLARHVAGLIVYTLAHVGGMFALRFAVYAAVDLRYEPGNAWHILAYEAGKDVVAYVLIVAICHGLWLYFDAQRRQQEMAQLRGELAEARLSRLAEQIQPHFLFNTLNMISSVMYEDVPKADRILCELATLLRQALAAQEAGSHTVAQELALVEPYLSIMRARFGEERLLIEVDVSDAARACLLPALLLISPVENAIKHDVAVTVGPVRIGVHGRVEAGGQLQLTVTNSGTAPERTTRDGAVGLANMRERLRVLYGDAARVELRAAPDGGSVLKLDLPAEPPKAVAP
jgi:two-component system, LytTR family, sensor kinase